MYKIIRLTIVSLLVVAFYSGSSVAQPASAAQTASSADSELRDPTTPLGLRASARSTVANQALILSSVFISPQRKVAIINGVSLREGQLVPGTNGVKVQRISPQTVVVQQASKTWALRLSPTVVTRH